MKPRLRWFWRAAIACNVGIVSSTVCYFAYGQAVESYILFRRLGSLEAYCMNYAAYVVNLVVVIAIYHWLTSPCWIEGTTFCGHCGYRLRGLSHPTCPECGRCI